MYEFYVQVYRPKQVANCVLFIHTVIAYRKTDTYDNTIVGSH